MKITIEGLQNTVLIKEGETRTVEYTPRINRMRLGGFVKIVKWHEDPPGKHAAVEKAADKPKKTTAKAKTAGESDDAPIIAEAAVEDEPVIAE